MKKNRRDPANIAFVEKVTKECAQNIISTYDTLQMFKHEPGFHEQGLVWPNISTWNDGMKLIVNAYPDKLFEKLGIYPEELVQAAEDYAKNKENETDHTMAVTEKVAKLKSKYME